MLCCSPKIQYPTQKSRMTSRSVRTCGLDMSATKTRASHVLTYVRFSVNFNFGAGASASSSWADMGGLVARGEGTAAGKPNDATEGPRLNPRLGKFAVVGGGLVAEPAGVGVTGAVPLLNSAQRGHLRFVSTGV